MSAAAVVLRKYEFGAKFIPLTEKLMVEVHLLKETLKQKLSF